MARHLIACLATTWILLGGAAVAQAPMPATPGTPGADPSAGAVPKKRSAKNLACRDAARQQGLRGEARKENVKACIKAARDACRIEATGLRGEERKARMRECMDRS